ncbi:MULTISPECIES: L-threonylcarbamoyladenylate synthase [Corynebacterium]|uniref:L-threonylcarbamoyladenylate synthase n=1 Tax=Corynebacterium aurimucosum TaxID=169292 RepID=A0A558GLH0_9CORY|nr:MULTISPECIES: L-threonylcarbamoyladenylate synthase [Corynebacterium]MBU5654181.1 threonylcarbamoyl-AMP synthase [Corynebacterium aurimucosum]MDK6812599.1 L-threonylcarbamoyladenylate synthase [Corynebacterium sp. UMB6689]OFL21385.1 threonylcarbamoyl-AMP synthase [Corynebacterium sp. HMSC062A03]OFP21167.1 threonylcarbamoyl-AMP synthase [Corynebacterium sp. HMSC066C02]OFQ33331.1 threonylcarbamoyl-AMP synthase [Corynebacterium sp. HMSC072D12]
MQGQIYNCADAAEREEGMALAVKAAKSGRLVVMPTDTLYGLGCDAFDNDAVASLLATKHRGPDMPVPVLVGSWDTVKGLVATLDDTAQTLIEAFWPGGLSIVVPQAPSLPWNLGDTRGTVMLRMPLHPIAIELLREVGPMAVSSANISGQTPPTTAIAAKQQLGKAVTVYLDGGEAEVGKPSTIIDLSGSHPYLLREGALSAEQIGEVIGVSAESLRTRPGSQSS